MSAGNSIAQSGVVWQKVTSPQSFQFITPLDVVSSLSKTQGAVSWAVWAELCELSCALHQPLPIPFWWGSKCSSCCCLCSARGKLHLLCPPSRQRCLGEFSDWAKLKGPSTPQTALSSVLTWILLLCLRSLGTALTPDLWKSFLPFCAVSAIMGFLRMESCIS